MTENRIYEVRKQNIPNKRLTAERLTASLKAAMQL